MPMTPPGAPTLTEKALPNGLPGMEVYFPTLDALAVTITVLRIADGVSESVHGMENRDVGGDFVETDWQIPLGIPVVYVGVITDAGGATVSGTQSAPVQVDRDEVWFQDPVDPENSYSFHLTDGNQDYLTGDAVSEITRTRRTATQFVFGKYRPFLQNFGMGALEGVPMDVRTETTEAFDALTLLLQMSPVIVRTPPIFVTLPRILSADIPQPIISTQRTARTDQWHVWLLRLDEVEPVGKAILRPLVTWDDWETAFPSGTYDWADVELLYSAGTWTDAVRNPP
jgi:hypothetical protein